MLEEALAKRYLTEAEHRDMVERLEEQHQDKMVALNAYKYGNTLDKTEQFFGDMATAFATGNERMLEISKAFGAAEGLINAWRTFSQVMADSSLPWFAKLPAAIALFGQAVTAVNAIKSVGKGGTGQSAVGGGGTTTPTPADPGGSSSPQQMRSLTLIGDRFNRAQAIEIAEFMNEGTDNGLIVRGRR